MANKILGEAALERLIVRIKNLVSQKVDTIDGKGLSTNDYTSTEKTKLAGIATGAEVNQNAFSNVKVGSTTISADTKTDTLTIVAGSNITITPDSGNDNITIAATNTVYSHPTYTAKNSGLYKVTVDSTGHVSGATAVAKSDITALGIPAQDTTYTLGSFGITATAAELNTLDGITATVAELNYTDGVTSNIQTQLNAKSDSSHTHKYAGSSSVGGAATSANKLNTNAGSGTQPVYFANGVPVATTYTLGASVPSGAKFTDTTYSAATTSAAGLMSAEDKTKLNGIATGANKITVDSALSSTSTNPVQNKVVNSAISAIRQLPTVTTSDNGKVLMVVNGAWKAVDLNLSVDANGVLSI
jgi:hypothetical protein